MTDIVFAAATGTGGAITIIRISGAGAGNLLRTLAGPLPRPRMATLRTLRGNSGQALDRGLVLWFPAPKSYTGEEYAELHIHGGRAVRTAVADVLVALGARPAEPGEFSRRAFANGKLDLLEAEGVADLINAETESQRRMAVEQADGEASSAVAHWRQTLIKLLAQLAAIIDFADDDLPTEVERTLRAELQSFREEIATALGAWDAAERLREGIDIVVLGAPNAGKSTLINALAGEEISIVSDIAGTTRDAVGTRVQIAGVPVRLVDTAGLRETTDSVEAEGVRRARAHGAKADLLLLLAPPPDFSFPRAPEGVESILISTKSDLLYTVPDGTLPISAKTGKNMSILADKLADAVRRLTDRGGAPGFARPRHRACLRDILSHLDNALAEYQPELCAAELQGASHVLARLAGAVGVEEVLDEVFSAFCIGK